MVKHNFLYLLMLWLLTESCSPVSIQTTNHLQAGDTEANKNNYSKALSYYQQYIKQSAKLGIYRNELLEAETHRKIAYVYQTQSRYDSSLIHLQFALDKDLKFPDNRSAIVTDITEIALLNAYQGKYKEALQNVNYYIDSLTFALRKNAERQAYSNLLLTKGRIEFALGEYINAETTLQKCNDIIALYPFHVQKAEVNHLLGLLYKDQGRFVESAEHLAISIAESKKENINATMPLHALGDLLFLQGLLETGIIKHTEALADAKKSNIIPLQIQSHIFIGEAYEFINDKKKATFHFQEAIQLQLKTESTGIQGKIFQNRKDYVSLLAYYQQNGQKAALAKAYVNWADTYKDNGKADSSLWVLKKAFTYYSNQNSLIEKRKVLVKALGNLLLFNRIDSAKNLVKIVDDAHPYPTTEYLFVKGKFFQKTGQPEEAKESLKDALANIEDTRSGFSVPAMRANYLGDKIFVYEELIELLMGENKVNDDAVTEAFTWNERARSRSFMDVVAAKKIKPLLPQHENILAQELALRLRVIKHKEETEQNEISAELLDNFKKAKKLHAYFADSLCKIDSQYAFLLSTNVAQPTELKKILSPDELLIEYWLGKNQSYVWLISSDSFSIIKLNKTEVEIERDITAFRNATKLNLQEDGKKLSEKLFKSLLASVPALAQFKKLIVVPHKTQNFLPFEALQNAAGEYLIQTHTITYAPSATIFMAKRKSQLELANKMLAMAIGDETFDTYEGLPGTVVEVQNIARYFNPTQVKIGLSSTETALKSYDASFDLIHLATHGVLNKVNPLQSFIVLKSDSLNDGHLTVSEILDLKIQSKLTTLSACETALGEVNRGNEITGLSTAFLYCGSKAVIVSLWKVDDEATSLLMTIFYEELSKGNSVSQAMALAQRKLIKIPEYSNQPYYWSPFIIIGDGNQ
jgi:CHAT domain-containing protein